MPAADRRPLATRSSAWAQALARALCRTSVTPNQISILSVVFAALGGAALLDGATHPVALVLAAVCVQLRLLCNLLDGMVAIEGGKHSATGVFFNEAPDRLGDALLLIPIGWVFGSPWWGWAIALAAFGAAYVRVLGASLGAGQDFCGPMAKPHRMAALTVGCLAGAVEGALLGTHVTVALTAVVLLVGTVATIARRSARLLRFLNDRGVA